MQWTTQTFRHEHRVVHRRRVDAQVDEGVVQGILLPPEAVSRPTTTWQRTHQRIEVQQHVALPRRPRLPPRAALHIDRLAEEQQRLVRLALLVLGNRVRARGGCVGRAEAPPQRRRAVVDDDRGLRVAVGCVWLGRRGLGGEIRRGQRMYVQRRGRLRGHVR